MIMFGSCAIYLTGMIVLHTSVIARWINIALILPCNILAISEGANKCCLHWVVCKSNDQFFNLFWWSSEMYLTIAVYSPLHSSLFIVLQNLVSHF